MLVTLQKVPMVIFTIVLYICAIRFLTKLRLQRALVSSLTTPSTSGLASIRFISKVPDEATTMFSHAARYRMIHSKLKPPCIIYGDVTRNEISEIRDSEELDLVLLVARSR